MKEEYQRRLAANTISKPFKMPSNKEGWANLLEVNDIQTANMITTDLEQEDHAADDVQHTHCAKVGPRPAQQRSQQKLCESQRARASSSDRAIGHKLLRDCYDTDPRHCI